MSGQLRQMPSPKFSQGGILIMVLIFCMITAIIAHSAIEMGILQLKMVSNFKTHQELVHEAQDELHKLEARLSTIDNFVSKEISFLQFVPDSLAFGEMKGVNYYSVSIHKELHDAQVQLKSTFCVRKIIEKAGDELPQEMKQYLASQLKDKLIVDSKAIQTHATGNILLVAYSSIENHNTQIAFIRFPSEEVLHVFSIDGKLTSKLLVVDTKANHRADLIFIGNESGDLLKIDISAPFVDDWHITRFNQVVEGAMIGTPLVGLHPQGKGLLLYCLVAQPNHQNTIAVLEQNAQGIKTFYTLTQAYYSQPLLWQGYLLAPIDHAQLAVVDAFSGKILQRYALQESPENIPLTPISVISKQPIDNKPTVLVSTKDAALFSAAPLLSKRLGRKTWKVVYL